MAQGTTRRQHSLGEPLGRAGVALSGKDLQERPDPYNHFGLLMTAVLNQGMLVTR